MCFSEEAGVVAVAISLIKEVIGAQYDPAGTSGEQLPVTKMKPHKNETSGPKILRLYRR